MVNPSKAVDKSYLPVAKPHTKLCSTKKRDKSLCKMKKTANHTKISYQLHSPLFRKEIPISNFGSKGTIDQIIQHENILTKVPFLIKKKLPTNSYLIKFTELAKNIEFRIKDDFNFLIENASGMNVTQVKEKFSEYICKPSNCQLNLVLFDVELPPSCQLDFVPKGCPVDIQLPKSIIPLTYFNKIFLIENGEEVSKANEMIQSGFKPQLNIMIQYNKADLNDSDKLRLNTNYTVTATQKFSFIKEPSHQVIKRILDYLITVNDAKNLLCGIFQG